MPLWNWGMKFRNQAHCWKLFNCKVSKGVPRQAEMAQGVPDRLRPRIFFTFRHYKGSRSSAKHTGRLCPRRNPWYSLSEAESTSGHMVLSGVPRKNPQWHHRESIPGPSDYATPGPKTVQLDIYIFCLNNAYKTIKYTYNLNQLY